MKVPDILFKPAYDSYVGRHLKLMPNWNELYLLQYKDHNKKLVRLACNIFNSLTILFEALKEIGRWTLRTLTLYYAFKRGPLLHVADLTSALAMVIFAICAMPFGFIPTPCDYKGFNGPLRPKTESALESVKKYISLGLLHEKNNDLIPETYGTRLLSKAIDEEDLEAIQLLFTNNVSINVSSFSIPLNHAIELNKLKSAEMLLKLGAKIYSEKEPLGLQIEYLYHPFFYAIFLNNSAAVKLILSSKPDMNLNHNGLTPLSYSVIKGDNKPFSLEIVQMLIEAGAEFNLYDVAELERFINALNSPERDLNHLDATLRISSNPFLKALLYACKFRSFPQEIMNVFDFLGQTVRACQELIKAKDELREFAITRNVRHLQSLAQLSPPLIRIISEY